MSQKQLAFSFSAWVRLESLQSRGCVSVDGLQPTNKKAHRMKEKSEYRFMIKILCFLSGPLENQNRKAIGERLAV